jgi:L-glutamine:2-deoxy-scyllo-inosose/3-amino-2,3-dideoxy-scyllo-inosose aminotransferase
MAVSRQRPAILQGEPVRRREWPKWPRADANTQRHVLDVLHSGKWTLTARSERSWSYEERFADAFAGYIGRKYCIPCANGSAGLTLALLATGVGFGDEVIVAGMTWVACASSVCYVNAIPRIIDVDMRSLCIDVATVDAAITPRTRAVIAPHMYAGRADARAIEALCRRRNIVLIEDASQAHGATIHGKRAGTYGDISIFSMQQTKLLCSGEGGACLTDDASVAAKLEQLRADGRRRALGNIGELFPRMIEAGDVMGRNYCLSEFHAAILIARLPQLDEENEYRRKNVERLTALVSQIDGVAIGQEDGLEADGAVFYKLPLRLRFDGGPILDPSIAARALTAELNLPVSTLDRPLDDNPLYRPHTASQVAALPIASRLLDPKQFHLPNAWLAWSDRIALPHSALLGDEADLHDIVEAIRKIIAWRTELTEFGNGSCA